VSSDKCYENKGWACGYREDDTLGGRDPYSSSKAAAEIVTAAYRSSFLDGTSSSASLSTARAGNVIGGGDWAQDRLVPDIMRAYLNNESAQIRNPASVRPWQHVLEPLRGYLSIIEHLLTSGPSFAEAWNFGPDGKDDRTAGEVAEALSAALGVPLETAKRDTRPVHEAGVLRLDSSKARTRLGWRSRLTLEQSLAMIVDWYKALKSRKDMRDFTLQQIDGYVSMLNANRMSQVAANQHED
jgi:CDP-glucose 4,6-dehydratase